MPIQKVVSVFDRAAQAFGRPIFVPNTAVAVRSLRDEMANSQSEIARHSDDYDLYEIGEFDDEDGSIDTPESPVLIVRCKDLSAT